MTKTEYIKMTIIVRDDPGANKSHVQDVIACARVIAAGFGSAKDAAHFMETKAIPAMRRVLR